MARELILTRFIVPHCYLTAAVLSPHSSISPCIGAIVAPLLRPLHYFHSSVPHGLRILYPLSLLLCYPRSLLSGHT